jgi:hypothetical protein
MPWLFASMITGYHLFRQKWIEAILFALSIAVLLFTYSRGGMLIAIISIGLVSLVLGRPFLEKIWKWVADPFRKQGRKSKSPSLALMSRTFLLLVIVVIVLGSFSFLSQYDYFANLWNASRNQSFTNYLIEINTAQRVAYAAAGYGVFEQHPITGVGLGANGLYLFEHFPDWSFAVPEIARQFSPDSNLIPNAKNLYVRLLAETGLPGFWFFLAFVFSFTAIIRKQLKSGQGWLRFVASAGLFAWTSIMVRNLTQDSLTLPIMWVALGMIAGFARKSNQ